MNIEFITQGLDLEKAEPTGSILIENLKKDVYSSFKAIVAFASRAGIVGLSRHIETAKNNGIEVSFIIGVDNEGTSKEALEELLNLNVNCFVYHTTQKVIFHPKIYLFQGSENLVIIGSSNITLPGLYQNVESSVNITFDEGDEDGNTILQHISFHFNTILTEDDANLQKLDQELINDLVSAGIVPSESVRLRRQNKKKKNINSERSNDALNKIKARFPSKELRKPDKEFGRTATETISSEEIFEVVPEMISEEEPTRGELVWQKNDLPKSDVQIVETGSTTNPTGGFRLTQAGFEVAGTRIDQTIYFRNNLFGTYTWEEVSDTPFVEVAKVPIRIVIENRDYGTYLLNVRHKPSGEAGQANYTTLISWGEVGNTIGRLKLNGKTMQMYRSTHQGNEIFEIVIS
jgi:HKD family nuclease